MPQAQFNCHSSPLVSVASHSNKKQTHFKFNTNSN